MSEELYRVRCSVGAAACDRRLATHLAHVVIPSCRHSIPEELIRQTLLSMVKPEPKVLVLDFKRLSRHMLDCHLVQVKRNTIVPLLSQFKWVAPALELTSVGSKPLATTLSLSQTTTGTTGTTGTTDAAVVDPEKTKFVQLVAAGPVACDANHDAAGIATADIATADIATAFTATAHEARQWAVKDFLGHPTAFARSQVVKNLFEDRFSEPLFLRRSEVVLVQLGRTMQLCGMWSVACQDTTTDALVIVPLRLALGQVLVEELCVLSKVVNMPSASAESISPSAALVAALSKWHNHVTNTPLFKLAKFPGSDLVADVRPLQEQALRKLGADALRAYTQQWRQGVACKALLASAMCFSAAAAESSAGASVSSAAAESSPGASASFAGASLDDFMPALDSECALFVGTRWWHGLSRAMPLRLLYIMEQSVFCVTRDRVTCLYTCPEPVFSDTWTPSATVDAHVQEYFRGLGVLLSGHVYSEHVLMTGKVIKPSTVDFL
jgi:hypothetical protein